MGLMVRVVLETKRDSVELLSWLKFDIEIVVRGLYLEMPPGY